NGSSKSEQGRFGDNPDELSKELIPCSSFQMLKSLLTIFKVCHVKRDLNRIRLQYPLPLLFETCPLVCKAHISRNRQYGRTGMGPTFVKISREHPHEAPTLIAV